MNVFVRTYVRRAMGAALAIASVASQAMAQAPTATVTGQVVTEQGQALEGANVYITEMNISVGTNAAGRYSIVIPAARVANQNVQVRVRAIGFTPQAKPVVVRAGTQTVDFSLRVDVNRLSAVVTTGVSGATEQVKVPFAVSKVDAADMPVPATNPLSQLQGKVPGANIVSASGRPGSNPAILLRAPTSIDASGRGQQPLIIIDGIITSGDLSSIAAEDIASIEVVKGAAAASLYGARAGNGVIQITTKSGRATDGTTFNVRTEYGVSDIEGSIAIAQNHPFQMNADGTRFCANADRSCTTTFDYQEEITKLNNQAATVPTLTGIPSPVNQTTSVWSTFQNGNWPGKTYNQVESIVDPGPFSQSNFDIQGRFGGTSFFTSFSNVIQQGSFVGLNGYRRNGFRVNLDHEFSSQLTMALRTYYSRANSDGQAAEGNVFFDLTRMPAGVNLLARDTLRNQYIIRPDLSAENENPIYDLAYRNRSDVTDRVLAGGTLTYKPFAWMDVEGNASFDQAATEQQRFVDKGFRTARAVSSLNNGNILNGTNDAQSMNGSVQATVRHDFASDLHTRVQVRSLYERQDNTLHNFAGYNLAVADVKSAANIDPTTIGLSNLDESIRQLSYFAIGNVEWKDRYIVDGLVRRDGSSLFGEENRWATFGRGSLAWRVAQEPWFKVPGIDEFKLRYSVGQAGGRPRFNAQYETYTLGGGKTDRNILGNKDLKPEIITEQEFGGDFEFFNRVGLNVTHSQATAKDQILLVPLSSTSGYVSQWQNAGTLDTKAWEASLNVPIITGKSFTWSSRVNYDMARSVISKLSVAPFQYGVNSQGLEGAFFARKGERLGTIYGVKFATSCADLPSTVQDKCATEFQKNDDGYLVWVGAGNSFRDGFKTGACATGTSSSRLWGCAAPFTLPALAGRQSTVLWGAPIVGEAADPTDASKRSTFQALGNTLPKYRMSFSNNMAFKRLSAFALLDASIGQKIYNQGRHWSYFENYSGDQDQGGKDSSSMKPIGYYGANVGLYNILAPNSAFVEDGSYAKLREVTLSYKIGRVGLARGDWNVSVIGRNLLTFTDYKGFDPEVGISGSGTGDTGSAVINAFDAYRFPNLRTVTFSIGATF